LVAIPAIAAEYRGAVKSAGLPIPGATVTATLLDKKFVTTTDDEGAYNFPDLSPGAWTITVEMLGFEKTTSTVDPSKPSPTATWDLHLLSQQALNQQFSSAAPRVKQPQNPAVSSVPTDVSASASPAKAPPGAAPNARPNAATTTDNQTGPPRRNRPTQSPDGSRPSLRQAMASQQQQSYRSLDVNASQDAQGSQAENMPGQQNEFSSGDLNQSASNAFVVNGSMSTGVNAPQQNDWGLFGPGGFGPNGPNFGPNGLGAQLPGGLGGPGGPGGPGGSGGPGAGGPGGGAAGGGFAGGGAGFGGGGFGGGGFGGPGRGGFGGGRGGRGPGPRTANSFGNARRGRRSQYNGNVALILDNSALDAKPYSLTGQETPKSSYNHLRSAGSFGGPLKIPKLISGEKTFFFINYQLTRNHNASIQDGLVPTEAERQGIIPGLGAIAISPQAQALLNLYPLPNFTGSTRYNYQVSTVGLTNQSNVNTRISQTINSKNQLTGNFAYQKNHTTNPNLFDFIDTTSMTGVNAGLQWTYHFTNRLISNLRYQFSRSASQSVPFFANTTNISGNAGIQGNDQSPLFYGPPTISFSSGISSLSDGNYALNHNQTSAVGENLIWVHGKHNITFGGDFRRLDFNQISQQNPRGSLLFNGSFTGNDFTDFLLSLPATSSIAYGNADKYFRTLWLDDFVSDDWRIKNNLTINFGVRWDFQAPVTELYNRLVNLSVGPDFTTATPVCATVHSGCTTSSVAGYPNSLLRPNYHEIQPRVGIAWRPLKGHSTVVRAGYGIYYNTSVYQNLASNLAQQSPLSFSVTQANTVCTYPCTPLYDISNAFLTPAVSATAQTYAIDPNFHIGYLHYWQASVQQNLSGSLILTLNYQGNKGTHQLQELLPNTFPTGSTTSSLPSGYAYITSGGNSNYNAASVQLQRRFRSGFSWNGMYIFSKAIDDAEGIGGRASVGSSYAQNWLDLSAERSLSSFNRTHQFNGTFQYSTGQGVTGGTLLSGWKGALAKDWTFSSTLTVASGLPETPIVLSRVATGTGFTGTLRADYIVGSLAPLLPGYGFNVDAFAAPQAGQYGNAGRDIITGPLQLNLNASAGRVFRLGERRNFDIRFDSTNVLNHVTFTSWNTTLGSAQFGLPAGASAMRSMQLTLRLRF